MDALKIIAQESTKAETPKFSIGDTVRVLLTSVRVREREFRCSRAQ